MSKEHTLIVIPGLGGDNKLFSHLVRKWDNEGFTTVVHDVHWHDGGDYDKKFGNLLDLIDELSEQDIRLSLIGTSAGGSIALNALYARTEAISKVVNICGRLRSGAGVYPTLEKAAKKSPAFKDSVLQCEMKSTEASKETKSRVLTMRAIYDEIVPVSTIALTEATNIQVPSVEHMLTIGLCMTVFSKPMFDFLKEK